MTKKVTVTFEMQNEHSFSCIVDDKFEKFGLIGYGPFDVGSFFSYYPFFNVTQFSKFAGLNPAQVRQYASGVRQPTEQKKQQLNEAVRNIIQTLLSDSRAFSID